jgi:hypothetical protein
VPTQAAVISGSDNVIIGSATRLPADLSDSIIIADGEETTFG